MSVLMPRLTPYEEHRDYVLGVLARRCGWLDPSDREALLHDAYTVFLEKQRAGTLDVGVMRGPQVRAYLTQTALNKAMDEGKRAGRRRSVSLDDEALGIDPADPGRELDERLASRFDDARVREIVAELPERQQLVIKLRFFFNRTPQEIQRYMGIGERVYRRELERATRQLAERLQLVREGGFCESRRSLILAYVTGVAGPNRLREARRHLESCPACASWAAELRVAARQAAAVVPIPLLSLPLTHAHAGYLLSAARGVHERIANLVVGTRGQVMRAVASTDPSRLASVSGARPSAVAVLITGCLAGGSTAAYCVVHGLPAPVQSLIGLNVESHHRSPEARRTAAKAPLAEARLEIVAHRAVPSMAQVSLATRHAARRTVTPARARPLSEAHKRPASAGVSASVRASRVEKATAPEFGIGSGTPVSTSSPASPPPSSPPSSSPHPVASPPPSQPSKPLPEFDP